MQILIKGGRIIDPDYMDEIVDIFIREGKISALKKTDSKSIDNNVPADENQIDRIIDATGYIVVPGLIDLHVHLRDPGEEYKETIETGIKAAAAGGFTSICCMPNTNPVNDNRQITEYIIRKAKQFQSVKVFPVAGISRGLQGGELCEYGELKEAGAIALSDDGFPVSDSQLMRRALEYSKGVGLKIISHCEEPELSTGVMNEGLMSTRLGLEGIPNAAESIMVARDIALSDLTGTPVHIAHVSAKESVWAIRDAKNKGIHVTAETAPHYFTLTDDALKEYDTHAKMNPPLRSVEDKKEIRAGLADGTIDIIATDHAPHSILEKEVEFDLAANGIIGLETSLPLGLNLVEDGVISFEMLIKKMSKNPASFLGISNDITIGTTADLTIIDPGRTHTYDVDSGYSKSRNSPFNGWKFKGMAVYTIVDGRVVFKI